MMKHSIASNIRRRKALCVSAAMALGSTINPTLVHGFTIQPPPRSYVTIPSTSLSNQRVMMPSGTRLFFSGGDDEKGGMLGQMKKKAKTTLNPKYWFMSDEEKQAAIKKQEYKDEFKGGIKQMLKGAPLPVQMMGSMIAPLLGNVLGSVAEQWGAQQEQVAAVLEEAQAAIVTDRVVSDVLGTPISIGTPFAQSSSTQQINSQVRTMIDIKFPVQGSRDSGVGTLSSSGNGIDYLSVNVGGREMRIDLSAPRRTSFADTSSPGSSFGKSKFDKDNVIDAEFIEKDQKP